VSPTVLLPTVAQQVVSEPMVDRSGFKEYLREASKVFSTRWFERRVPRFVRHCDGRRNVVKELGELCSMWRLTLEGEIVDVQV
ncbi:hypothetical protein PIB30_078691, partial [Stylosanthes scabra]|nr:hypothetical protein [Stylosanthes scabra]